MDKPNLNVDLNPNDLETMTCECGMQVWIQAMIIKKASRFQIGETKDRLLQIPLVVCAKCKKPMPDQLTFEL